MNPWLDERNHKREMQILGNQYGDADSTQNTVFCLFEPDAPGLSADSFPTMDAVLFGTRPGKRYSFAPPMAEMPKDKCMELIRGWWAKHSDREPTDEVIERIVWEYQNVTDGRGLAKVMDELAAKYPSKVAADYVPALPVMPDLVQALNIAAADTRGVIVLVLTGGEADAALERQVSRLAFEEGIAGRTHLARLTADEWANAKRAGRVTGGSLDAGLIFVAPDPFGLDGEVWAEIAPDTAPEAMRTQLVAGLDRFCAEWRKLDRASHIKEGVAKDISWTEYDPDFDSIRRIGKNSKKLGN